MAGLCDKQGFNIFLRILPSFSVAVTVESGKYMNSSIYFFGFYEFLWFTLDLYILGPLKCLEVLKAQRPPISCFCGSLFNSFFHVFVKDKHNL